MKYEITVEGRHYQTESSKRFTAWNKAVTMHAWWKARDYDSEAACLKFGYISMKNFHRNLKQVGYRIIRRKSRFYKLTDEDAHKAATLNVSGYNLGQVVNEFKTSRYILDGAFKRINYSPLVKSYVSPKKGRKVVKKVKQSKWNFILYSKPFGYDTDFVMCDSSQLVLRHGCRKTF